VLQLLLIFRLGFMPFISYMEVGCVPESCTLGVPRSRVSG
jgi:hypothetical protein